MIEINLEFTEAELKKRLEYPYIWHSIQFDLWDNKTRFVYNVPIFKDVVKKINQMDNKEIKDYALVRWYNYWSAKAIEQIFANHNNVEYDRNNHNSKVDFKIKGIEFDHKTSVFPKRINKDISFCLNNKSYLINWLYMNQSNGSRKHFGNKIFLVLYKTNGDHWKLKSELKKINNAIDAFFLNFNVKNFTELNINRNEILSDIIWVIE